MEADIEMEIKKQNKESNDNISTSQSTTTNHITEINLFEVNLVIHVVL